MQLWHHCSTQPRLVGAKAQIIPRKESTVGKGSALTFSLSLLSLLGLERYKFGIPCLCPITSDCLLFPRKKGKWGRQPAWNSLWDQAEIPSHSPGQTATGKKEKPQEMEVLSSPALKPPCHRAGSTLGTAMEVAVNKRWRDSPAGRRVTWLWYLNSLFLTASAYHEIPVWF